MDVQGLNDENTGQSGARPADANHSSGPEPDHTILPTVGPDGAIPEWNDFYRAIREAVLAMRSPK